jgi:hypothetical protein
MPHQKVPLRLQYFHFATFINKDCTAPDRKIHNRIACVLIDKNGIQIQTISDLLKELTVIPTIMWWLQKRETVNK